MNKEINIIGPGNVEIRTCEMPVPKGNEALLKMVYGGICGSDLNTYRGASAYVSYPKVPGHELSCVIVEIGENYKGLKKGDSVTVNPYFNCHKCYSCERGHVNACMFNETMGVQREGGFREYLTMNVERLIAVEDLSSKEIALMEPFCIGYHGVKKANVKKGDNVLIVGAGSIGVLSMFGALYRGAKVYLSDISQDKLDYAISLGASGGILNSSKEEFDKQVSDITDGNGFDICMEVVGLPSTFQNCIDAAAFGGSVVLIGISKSNLDFNFTMIQKKELKIYGSRNALKEDFEEVAEIMKVYDATKIVTNVYSFIDSENAFADMDANAGKMLKTLIEF